MFVDPGVDAILLNRPDLRRSVAQGHFPENTRVSRIGHVYVPLARDPDSAIRQDRLAGTEVLTFGVPDGLIGKPDKFHLHCMEQAEPGRWAGVVTGWDGQALSSHGGEPGEGTAHWQGYFGNSSLAVVRIVRRSPWLCVLSIVRSHLEKVDQVPARRVRMKQELVLSINCRVEHSAPIPGLDVPAHLRAQWQPAVEALYELFECQLPGCTRVHYAA